MLQCTSRVVSSVNSCCVSDYYGGELYIYIYIHTHIYFNASCCENFLAAISAFSKGLFF